MRLDGTDGERWNEHALKNGQSCGSIIIVERCGRCRTMTMRFRTTYTHIQSSLSLSSTSDNNVERRTTASLVTDAHGSAKLPFSCVSSAPLNIYIYTYIFLSSPFLAVSRGAWIAVASSIRSRNDPDSSNGSDVVAGLSVKEEKREMRLFVPHCF